MVGLAKKPTPRETLKITAYDKFLQRKGWVANPVSCSFTQRDLAQGTGSLMVSPHDPILKHLMTDGARLVVEYRDRPFMSGTVWGASGSILDDQPVTLQLRDDWMHTETPAYVRPAGNVVAATLTDLAQATVTGSAGAVGTVKGQGGYYKWPAVSSREAAVKAILIENLRDRLGMNIRAMPDQGRGGPATNLPRVRFSTLAEAITPVLRAGGLTLKIWQGLGDAFLSIDVAATTVHPKAMTAKSGVLKGGTWTTNPPQVTRPLLGGPGEVAARAFWPMVDTAREAQWGIVLERFKDATGASLEWIDGTDDALKVAKYYLLSPYVAAAEKAEFTAYMTEIAENMLVEGQATSGLAIELSETDRFHFGGADGIQLGDLVPVMAQGREFSQNRVTEATITLSKDGAFTVTPFVGERTNDPSRKLAQAIAAVARSQYRNITSR
jgi:hypothetical protein